MSGSCSGSRAIPRWHHCQQIWSVSWHWHHGQFQNGFQISLDKASRNLEVSTSSRSSRSRLLSQSWLKCPFNKQSPDWSRCSKVWTVLCAHTSGHTQHGSKSKFSNFPNLRVPNCPSWVLGFHAPLQMLSLPSPPSQTTCLTPYLAAWRQIALDQLVLSVISEVYVIEFVQTSPPPSSSSLHLWMPCWKR